MRAINATSGDQLSPLTIELTSYIYIRHSSVPSQRANSPSISIFYPLLLELVRLAAMSSAGDGAPPGHTASTVVAQPLSGSHVFRIDGYSRLKGFAEDTCFTSATFSVGGHRWCIEY
jgi:hypothetical protein